MGGKVDHDVAMMALELHPELLAAAESLQMGRAGQLEFPVENVETLVTLLESAGNTLSYGGRDVTGDDIRKFVPDTFFPIESEKDLLTRLLISFLIGRQSHFQNDTVPELVCYATTDEKGKG